MGRQWPFWVLGAVALNSFASRALWQLSRERKNLRQTAEMLSRRNEQLQALSNVYNQIAENMGAQEVVNASLNEIIKLMGTDMVSLRRLEGEWLVSVGAIMHNGRPMKLARSMKVGEGLTGIAVQEKRTIRVGRGAELSMAPIGTPDPDDVSPSEQSGSPRQESGIVAPLVVGSHIVGALAVWSTEIDHFSAEDEAVFEMMASQVATAMVAASVMDERDRLAHVDALTGLPNRLQLAEDLKGDLAALAAHERSAVFAMADIDNFKGFNDAFGHSGGDLVLQRLGTILSTSIRPSDRVYRYGGEEFLIVFVDTTPEDGQRLAEAVRRAVAAQLNLPPVTISIGLAALPRDSMRPHALIELADNAMYRAKRAGGNRTEAWYQREEKEAVA